MEGDYQQKTGGGVAAELDVEECYRRATEARRIADGPGVGEAEKADLLEVERRWLFLARSREPAADQSLTRLRRVSED
jgi:hypothetical protein